MDKAEIFLLPNSLDSDNFDMNLFSANLASIVSGLNGIFVEDEKNARKYLLQFMDRSKMQNIFMRRLNRHTDESDLSDFIDLIKKGGKFGILSDAGLPCIADPGSKLVELANKNSIPVKSVCGPSSIMMALMLSGFSAQKFIFHGYLPRKPEELKQALQELEKNAKTELSTHIWIETPYRSDKMLQMCLKELNNTTFLCVAMNLTTKNEKVISLPVSRWNQNKIEIGKNPCVFLMALSASKK